MVGGIPIMCDDFLVSFGEGLKEVCTTLKEVGSCYRLWHH